MVMLYSLRHNLVTSVLMFAFIDCITDFILCSFIASSDIKIHNKDETFSDYFSDIIQFPQSGSSRLMLLIWELLSYFNTTNYQPGCKDKP